MVTEQRVGVYGVQTAKRMRRRSRQRCAIGRQFCRLESGQTESRDGSRGVSDDEMTRSRV